MEGENFQPPDNPAEIEIQNHSVARQDSPNLDMLINSNLSPIRNESDQNLDAEVGDSQIDDPSENLQNRADQEVGLNQGFQNPGINSQPETYQEEPGMMQEEIIPSNNPPLQLRGHDPEEF
jgi:hypothetical protein